MKNRFDDILKRRWEEIQFPVEDTHRNEMIQLLDQNKRRKTGLAWWGGGIVLILAISGMLWFQNTGAVVKDKIQPENTGTSSDMNKDRASARENGTENILEPSTEKQQNGNSKDEITSNLAHQKNSVSVTDAKIAVEQGRTVYTPVKSREYASQPNPGTYEGVKPKTSDYVALPESEVHAEVMSSYDAVDGRTQEIAEPNFTEVKVADNTLPVIPVNYRNANISPFIESIAISDIEFTRETFDSPIEPAFHLTHPFHFFVETGIGYIPPSRPDIIKAGWNIKAGGGVGYRLFSKIELFASAGYMLQKGGFAFQRTSTVNQPVFGTRSNFHSLTPDKLHSVYARAGVLHRLRRHILSASGGMQWIYGAQGTIIINTIDQFVNGPEEKTQYGWVKLDGMQRVLLNAEINYGYQLTPRILLLSGIKYNFSKLTVVDPELATEYYWKGRFASFNPSFTINYRLYGK